LEVRVLESTQFKSFYRIALDFYAENQGKVTVPVTEEFYELKVTGH
jgi:hypothetical protein